jgi:PadR family transcriptional regulator
VKQLTRADEALLVTVWCLGEDAYSSTILEELAERAGKSVSVGSLWVSMDALADKGFVRKSSRKTDGSSRPRVYYSLSPKGLRALKRVREYEKQLWEGVAGI